MCETPYIPPDLWEYIWGFDGTVVEFQKYRLISKEVYQLPWKELLKNVSFLINIRKNDDWKRHDFSYVSRINLGDTWSITGLESALMRNSNFQYIRNMSEICISWINISTESFIHLGRNNPHLEKLHLYIKREDPQLEFTPLPHSAWKTLCCSKSHGFPFDEFQSIRSLTLDGYISNDHVNFALMLRNLEELSLPISNVSINQLKRFSLKKLDTHGFHNYKRKDETLDDEVIDLLARTRDLGWISGPIVPYSIFSGKETLKIGGDDSIIDGVLLSSKLKGLTSLYITYPEKIGNFHCIMRHCASTITKLTIFPQCTFDGMTDDLLIQFSSLKKLILSDCPRVKGTFITRLKSLNWLELDHCSGILPTFLGGCHERWLSKLAFNNMDQINDNTLASLKGVTHLSIQNCLNFTGSSLLVLGGLRTLRLGIWLHSLPSNVNQLINSNPSLCTCRDYDRLYKHYTSQYHHALVSFLSTLIHHCDYLYYVGKEALSKHDLQMLQKFPRLQLK